LAEGRGVGARPVTVYSTVSAHHARSGRDRGIFVRRRLLSSRGGRSRGHARAEVPGFFALAAETPALHAACRPPGGDVAAARSLRPSAGGACEETMPRARDVTPRCGPPVSTLTFLAAEPGSRIPASGFSAHRRRDPTRLPRIQSAAGGPAAEARSRDQQIAGRHNRGPASTFRLPQAVAPLREANDDGPRPGSPPSCRLAMCSS
jgi:hypothetical protein